MAKRIVVHGINKRTELLINLETWIDLQGIIGSEKKLIQKRCIAYDSIFEMRKF